MECRSIFVRMAARKNLAFFRAGVKAFADFFMFDICGGFFQK